MAKYDPLKFHLLRTYPQSLVMTFGDIETLLGEPLPKSARRPQFWVRVPENQDRAQQQALRTAGYNAVLLADSRGVRFEPELKQGGQTSGVKNPLRDPIGDSATGPIPVRLDPSPETNWWDRPKRGSALRIYEILGLAAGIVAMFFAIEGLNRANEQTALAQASLADQRLSSAWQILASNNGGVAGQIYALESLTGLQDELRFFEFRCATSCVAPHNLTGIRVNGTRKSDGSDRPSGFTFGDMTFENVGLEGAEFIGVRFDGVTFASDVSLFATSFIDPVLENVRFWRDLPDITGGTFTQVSVFGANLIGSEISATRSSLMVNIGAADFCWRADSCAKIDRTFFDGAWFDADHPPKGLKYLYPDLNVLSCGPPTIRVSDGSPSRAGRECVPIAAGDIQDPQWLQ